MDKQCSACGGQLEPGFLRAHCVWLILNSFDFIRPNVPTSANPVRAFFQGLHEEPGEQRLPLAAFRCTGCGRLELFAPDEESSEERLATTTEQGEGR